MNNEEMMAAVKYHRENLGFNSSEVAAAIGYDVSKYSRLENNKQPILAIELYQISRLFNMTLEELIIIPTRKKLY